MDKLIARIKSHVQELGTCWEWQGYCKKRGGVPMINYMGKVQPVRRVLAIHLGMDCENNVVTNSCCNLLCVNPKHLQVMQRLTLAQRTGKAKSGVPLPIPVCIKLAKRRRASSKLTPEMVAAIRADTRLQKVIAKEYGIGKSTVSSIKRGLRWGDYSNPFLQLLK